MTFRDILKNSSRWNEQTLTDLANMLVSNGIAQIEFPHTGKAGRPAGRTLVLTDGRTV
jgi:hypothetical protein